LSFFSEEFQELLFDHRNKPKKKAVNVGSFTITDRYHDVFVGSTDYEEATDNMSHEVGSLIGSFCMTITGIPKGMRVLV
jgi:hypothetical protein